MKLLTVQQGTPEWHTARAAHFCASEAAAMLGLSKYITRNELLRQKATGIIPEVDANKQRLFDAGHAAEFDARGIVEEIIGGELFPCVCTIEVEGLPLLASMDGLTMCETIAWETKLLNQVLVSAIQAGEVPDSYWPQLEQCLLVSGAEKVFFTTSDGTAEGTYGTWYTSNPERRSALILGWDQFKTDLDNYQHVEVIPAAVAKPTLDLPAVSIQASGALTIRSNLRVFGEQLNRFIEALPTKPSTDQEFADCKAALGKLKTAEETLDSEEARALSQLDEIEEMRREKKLYSDLARTTRLALEKLVTAREAAIKVEIMQGGKDKLAAHIATLNVEIEPLQLVIQSPDFATAIKNKRTVSSLQNAVDTLLASKKIEASEIASETRRRLTWFKEYAAGFEFLFPDLQQIIFLN